MKVNKADLLRTLKQDLSSAKDMKATIDQRVAERRDIYNGKLYGNEEEGKSKIVVKLAKRQSEWGHAKIKDPFVSTPEIVKCNPVTFEDVQAARQNELLLNYQFCRQFDRYKFMTKAIKVLDVDATLVVQTGWVYEDEEITQMTDVVEVDEHGNEFITTQIVPTIRVKKNQPTARVCRSEDVFIDPTCQDDIDNAQFVIFRYETDLSTLKKDGRYKNLDKLKEAGDELSSDEDFDPEDETEFKFSDKARKKLLVYEYWGNYDIDDDGEVEPIVCAWIGGTIIRLGSNPYPDKKPPFIVVPFSSVPFQLHGENNIDLIEDNQKVTTAITRGIINNMAQSTNGQVGIRKGALDAIQRKKFFSGKNFEFNGSPADFWQGSFNQIPGSAFDMMALQNNEAESLTGTKAFSQGLTGNALGNTATAARGVMDATASRTLDTVRNIAENLIKPLMRKWMAYNSEFLSEEEVVRVTNSEFVPIRRDDLAGNIDIDIAISTAEDNSMKMQELTFLLQTLGNTLPFELTQKVLVQIARLSRQPELEKDVAEFKPQPDPMAEQMKQLEMAKLQAEVQYLQARSFAAQASAGEDDADKAEKLAQAELKRAQARKLMSEADNLDLKFIADDGQVKHQEDIEKEQMKHQQKLELEDMKRLARLDEMAFQIKYGHKNEQIGVPK